MAQSVGLTSFVNTRDRELVSVLEDKSRSLGSDPIPLYPRFVTLPTLPQAGGEIEKIAIAPHILATNLHISSVILPNVVSLYLRTIL